MHGQPKSSEEKLWELWVCSLLWVMQDFYQALVAELRQDTERPVSVPAKSEAKDHARSSEEKAF